MKTALTFALAFMLSANAWAAAAAVAPIPADAPIFNGVMTIGAESRFVLLAKDGKSSPWIKLGDSFAEYKLKSYEAKDSALELEKDGKAFTIRLDSGRGTQQGGAATATPGTIAAANDLMKIMRFEEMMNKIMDQQSKAMGPMMRAPMEQAAARLNLSPEEQKEFLEFQENAMKQIFGNIMGPDFKSEMAKVYSETFTQDELAAQAAFYSTPAGQTYVEKQPEISAKINAAITPRLMANVGAMQQSMQTYMRDLARKRAAAAAPAAPTAP